MSELIIEPLEAEVTPEDFDVFVAQEDNIDHNWELIDGEMIEAMVTGSKATRLTARLAAFVGMFVITHRLGQMSSAEGGYRVGRNRVIPDIAFTRQERFVDEQIKGYYVFAPDLAIEVISPTDRMSKIQKKVAIYLEGNVVVWLVDPESETVIVYHPDKLPQTLKRDDTLDGGDVLVGFSLALSELFDL